MGILPATIGGFKEESLDLDGTIWDWSDEQVKMVNVSAKMVTSPRRLSFFTSNMGVQTTNTIWLVVDLPLLKNMKVNWKGLSHILWNNKKCSKPPPSILSDIVFSATNTFDLINNPKNMIQSARGEISPAAASDQWRCQWRQLDTSFFSVHILKLNKTAWRFTRYGG